MEEEVKWQSKTAKLKRDKHIDAAQTLKKSEADLAKARNKAKEEGYEAGVAETQASLKAQIPGVCKLYCSQVWEEALKRAGVEASSDLWKAEDVFYPLAIRETASASSEAMSAPQEAGAAQIIVTPSEPTEGGEPHDAMEAPGGLNPEMPKEGTEPTVSAQIFGAEEPAIFV